MSARRSHIRRPLLDEAVRLDLGGYPDAAEALLGIVDGFWAWPLSPGAVRARLDHALLQSRVPSAESDRIRAVVARAERGRSFATRRYLQRKDANCRRVIGWLATPDCAMPPEWHAARPERERQAAETVARFLAMDRERRRAIMAMAA